MRSDVRVVPGPPFLGFASDTDAITVWGHSSAGRAVALQASGHRFDPDRLHHLHNLEMKRNGSPCESAVIGSRRPVFDIVNGFFKIDAVRCSILGTRIASAVRKALLCKAI